MRNEQFSIQRSFWDIWSDRFRGVSPIIVSMKPVHNGAVLLERLVFDKNSRLYRKRKITYTNDELPSLTAMLNDSKK
jgi:hypothetical protein